MTGHGQVTRNVPGVLRDLGAGWRLTWRAGPWLAGGQLACVIVSSLLPPSVVWLTKLLMDGLATRQPGSALLVWSIGLAGAGLATAALPQLTNYVQSELGRSVDR